MKFQCVGFDVRVWPWDGGFYVDDTGWSLNDRVCELIKEKFNVIENSWQLMEFSSKEQFEEVCSYTLSIDEANLNSVEIPLDIAQEYSSKWAINSFGKKIKFDQFITRGLDVCDLNGWFSANHAPEIFAKTNGILPAESILLATDAAILANIIRPEHTPHIIARIRTLK